MKDPLTFKVPYLPSETIIGPVTSSSVSSLPSLATPAQLSIQSLPPMLELDLAEPFALVNEPCYESSLFNRSVGTCTVSTHNPAWSPVTPDLISSFTCDSSPENILSTLQSTGLLISVPEDFADEQTYASVFRSKPQLGITLLELIDTILNLEYSVDFCIHQNSFF
ncbi:hypothetical protein BT96DRAFT_1010298 [Gymnopus androsaceus JB14]|uniref:Uncharacterized protein n=1 Tax=Gymnopus androsaceus JB14 TaxID=1447944 RepID=A0A6A4GAY4_9AGAR|nr:hypothetical protein BT96DRAFT_1010298 [Gymnopus androsaceus JB14]